MVIWEAFGIYILSGFGYRIVQGFLNINTASLLLE
jgi:hypothetical protein